MNEPFQHPFLTESQHKSLLIAAKILKEAGELSCLTDDAHITLLMVTNGVDVPAVQAGDNHKVILFSDDKWSYVVVRYGGFADKQDNGLGAIKIKRDYLQAEFKRAGVGDDWPKRILDFMLCILQVDPRKVDFTGKLIEEAQ